MLRLMTWNCLGMVDSAKRQKLESYKQAQKIDYVFLQEGSETYTSAISEKNTNSSTFMVQAEAALASSDKQVLELAFAGPSMLGPCIFGEGGVDRTAYYNVLGAGVGMVHEPDACDYTMSPFVREWVFAPAKNCSLIRDRNTSKLLIGGSGRRKSLTNRRLCDERVTNPVQKRANLLAHRRPKRVTVKDGGKDVQIYHWHAPLGGDVKLDTLGLGKGNEKIAKLGSGGELAVAANLLFKMFLAGSGEFPKNTLLVGDLNIKSTAVRHIFGDLELASEDGWCHAVAPKGATLTLLDKSNTEANATALGGSDHTPIVFDVTFPI